MHLAHPQYLWLFFVFIPLIVWYILKQRNANASLNVSSMEPFARLPRSYKEYLKHFLFALRLATLGCLIIVLARPQTHDSWRTSNTEGIDIVIAIDISSSMLARDFKPDRIGAAKNVAASFVNGREFDNIGIVIFAAESFTAVPMTSDRPVLINYIDNIEMGLLRDGTAIGDGLATAINRIKEGKAKSKCIILLTDGVNNTGIVSPSTAAEIAKKYDIKIYTVGIGTNGMAPMPAQNMFGRIEYVQQKVTIDEGLLKEMADMTGGKYYRATNNAVLSEVFAEIDHLEKTQMDVKNFSHTEDNYLIWAWLALGLFVFELILRHTLLRSIP